MNIKDRFAVLCKDPDFINAYNDFNGTKLTVLDQSQLFSVGTLCHLVTINMKTGSELLLTDAYYNIEYKAKNYIATGDFTDISTIDEEKEIQNTGMSVKLANVRTEYINLVRTKQLDVADVKIDIAFLNPETGVVAETFNLFTGEIDKLTINIEYDDNESKNETEAQLNSIWAVLEKSARNYASDGVHRSYPGSENDVFFSRIGKWNSEQKWTSKK
ncbi:hypothetical protein ABKV35_14060 [Enterobacter kobei]|uniref:baseplate hub domain-containing protein n=1 Tax=Enterobacter kobei TaxID=208224 RepID=UPI0032AF61C9